MSEPAWVPLGGAVPTPGPLILARAAGVEAVSSSAEVTLASLIVPAGVMSTDRMLRLTLMGDWLHNNVAGDTCTLRFKFGGTTHVSVLDLCGANIGAGRKPWWMEMLVANLAAANSQQINVVGFSAWSNMAAPVTGIGGMASTPGTGEYLSAAVSALASIDTTVQQVIAVSAQWSAASANDSYRSRYGVLELI